MPYIKLTKDNFESEVKASELPVLIDFYADWCGPCKMLAPIISEIAEEYAGKVKVCKVNVDDESELASAFSVQSIPTVVVVKDGVITDVSVGYKPKNELIAMLG